jgi:tRNA U34 5-carboxymethylaminomethyl modifying GTPase MnmE/TrmE
LVVLVTDRSAPWSPDDQALRDQWPTALLVHNKCDLPPTPGSRPAGLPTGALRGEGIDALLAAIGQRLAPNLPTPGAPVLFSSEQAEILRQWRAAAEK